ncbi:MAG: hypothetical protein Q8L71_02660 [Thiobacillus sp.]|nr:hypothetical protein [Thiobacillus sp.]
MRFMFPRRLLPWLFALILLFGQVAAFAHALTHLRAHDSALPDKTCEVCVAQAQLGAAVAPSLLVLTIPPGDCIIASSAAPLCVDLAPRPACARAPPAPSNS